MAKASKDSFEKAWAEIIKKCASDEVFKQRFLQNPAQVFKDYGVEMPAGITLKVVENTAKVRYLVLPESKMALGLSEEELRKVAGGAGSAYLPKSDVIFGG